MRFAISPEQKRFFEQNQMIELEGVLSQQQLTSFKEAVFKVLALRLHKNPEFLRECSSSEIFMQGHDLWREEDVVKKIATHRALSELFFQFTNHRSFRLGYDQLLPAMVDKSFRIVEPNGYTSFIKTGALLEQVSSIQGILGGMILCLEEGETPLEGWPSSAGSALLFSKESPLYLQNLQQRSHALYYLIAYCREKSVYVMQEDDPHAHFFKKIGYNSGDRLIDKYNPILFR